MSRGIRKAVGGTLTITNANTELITKEALSGCFQNGIPLIAGFSIINRSEQTAQIKINGGTILDMRSQEGYELKDLCDVSSCIVLTPEVEITWCGILI